MRLLKAYIANFGKLSDFKCEFNDGLNVVAEDNGWGKTTLSVFIKAMLFGLPSTQKRELKENERKKYTPWQGGSFGGYLELETSLGTFRAERYFGQRESDDTFVLYDLTTGKQSSAYSSDIGAELFKIDREGFERTVFIGETASIGTNTSITAKLNELLEADDVNNYQDTVKALTQRLKSYTSPTAGSIAAAKNELSVMRQRAEKSVRDSELYMQKSAQKAQKEAELKATQVGLADARSKLDQYAKENERRVTIERLHTLAENRQTLSDKVDELNAFFGGEIPQKSDLDECEALIAECGAAQAKYADKQAEIINEQLAYDDKTAQLKDEIAAKCTVFTLGARPSTDTVDNLLIALKAQSAPAEVMPKTKEKNDIKPFIVPIFCLILSLALFATGVALCFFVPAAGYALMGVSVAILTAGIAIYLKRAKTVIKPQATPIEQTPACSAEQNAKGFLNGIRLARTEDLEADLKAVKAYLMDVESLENERALIKKQFDARMETLKVRLDECEAELDRLSSKLNFALRKSNISPIGDTKTLISEYKTKLSQLSVLQSELGAACAAIKTIEEQSGLSIATKTTLELNDYPALKQAEQALHNKEVLLREELSALYSGMQQLAASVDSADDYQNEVDRLQDALSDLTEDSKICKATIDHLQNAKEQLSARYLGDMKKSFVKFANELTSSAIPDVMLSTELNVSFDKAGKQRELEYFSRGYKSIATFSMRLALIDALYKNEKPFIIMDDPFLALDNDKYASAINGITLLANDYQILYFSCDKNKSTFNRK